jgi:ribosomal-protein-alanine N-acetyltransferase
MVAIQTDRLLLRRWRDSDREPFARINADLRVMEYFPAPLTRAESDTFIDRIEACFVERGYSLWAAELRDASEFIGFIGLSVPAFQAYFTPCVEIGWRLTADHWGRGLATEGARAVLRYAFNDLGLHEVVSFTAATNLRSIQVMQKLGMTRNPAEDFNPLRRHVLYRKTALSRQPSANN